MECSNGTSFTMVFGRLPCWVRVSYPLNRYSGFFRYNLESRMSLIAYLVILLTSSGRGGDLSCPGKGLLGASSRQDTWNTGYNSMLWGRSSS